MRRQVLQLPGMRTVKVVVSLSMNLSALNLLAPSEFRLPHRNNVMLGDTKNLSLIKVNHQTIVYGGYP